VVLALACRLELEVGVASCRLEVVEEVASCRLEVVEEKALEGRALVGEVGTPSGGMEERL